jgi:hypothetical protein
MIFLPNSSSWLLCGCPLQESSYLRLQHYRHLSGSVSSWALVWQATFCQQNLRRFRTHYSVVSAGAWTLQSITRYRMRRPVKWSKRQTPRNTRSSRERLDASRAKLLEWTAHLPQYSYKSAVVPPVPFRLTPRHWGIHKSKYNLSRDTGLPSLSYLGASV